MKKILITGENSYIGNSFIKWISQWPDKYEVDVISVRTDEWKELDFRKFHTIIHLAAIVHKKEKKNMENLYYKVNKELAVEIAVKAKLSGVRQFIFMSSLSVYGLNGDVKKDVTITKSTPCIPKTLYGKSKLAAESDILKLSDNQFKVVIIRAPMIYGPDCPGNYSKLKKLVLKFPIFPLFENRRSMIFINNLSQFIKSVVDTQSKGVFIPQNKEYVATKDLVKQIAFQYNKKIIFLKISPFPVYLLSKRISIINKMFGNLIVDKSLSYFNGVDYSTCSFEESIYKCEKSQRLV